MFFYKIINLVVNRRNKYPYLAKAIVQILNEFLTLFLTPCLRYDFGRRALCFPYDRGKIWDKTINLLPFNRGELKRGYKIWGDGWIGAPSSLIPIPFAVLVQK